MVPSGSKQRSTPFCIVDEAERLFSEIGFQKTTVGDIAKALHMSAANIYRFFPAKVAINEAVAARLLREVEEAIEDIVAASGRASDKLRNYMATLERLMPR